MMVCPKCGKLIEYGVNGCQWLQECFTCHGYPQYPKPVDKTGEVSREYADYIEGILIDRGDE